jgi:DNA-binding GntR family transcriptional regulator
VPDWSKVAHVIKERLGSRQKRGSTTDVVTDALREAILDGTIPPSTWLREEDLSREFVVSRTPIRESLRRLADENLVTRTANRGSVVQALTLEEVLGVYMVREVLEGLAVHMAVVRMPDGMVNELLRVHQASVEAAAANDPVLANKLYLEFHRIIRNATGNTLLIRFLGQVENAVRRAGVSPYQDPKRLEENSAEHLQLIEAIASGDADAARAAAIHHMRKAREARVRVLLGVSLESPVISL